MLSFPLQNSPYTSCTRCTTRLFNCASLHGKRRSKVKIVDSRLISILTEYLVKIGSSQYFFSSPKTSLRFLLHPREKPFLSGPFRNVGARNVSVREKHITYFKAASSRGGGMNRIKLIYRENRLWQAEAILKYIVGAKNTKSIKKKSEDYISPKRNSHISLFTFNIRSKIERSIISTRKIPHPYFTDG